ncbi:hypothetical protein U728_1112 [Clostridium botulinum 202F]|nr:hypothetical protein U728_1112 [Clostridium botulinum 202F]KAI3344392.1 hypothetical protein CIT17_17390 [Clostridium botulinum]MBY6987101.1 hypothetical protein [Clostridium botulinum]NFH02184.1 hypothetical protein [Clostridium botulinum]NFI80985.1 hypothetical protein [Clostridium botulinum]
MKLSKELNILQAIEMPVGTEFEVILDGEKYNMNAKITKAKVVGKKQLVWDNRAYIEVVINDSILNAKFIPIQQPVSFMEAIKAYNNEHKTIFNKRKNYVGRYHTYKYCNAKERGSLFDENAGTICSYEILNCEWYIQEDNAND